MKLKILLLEDRPTDAELMLRELRRAGYTPEWQRVETEADYLAQLNQGWEIILADFNLPRFTGLQALELLKARALDIPFMIVSGTIGEDKAVAAMKAGASDFIMKDQLARLGPAVERELRDAAERRKRREVEESLRASEVRYRRLFESAKDGILILDAETGIVVDANPFLAELLGYTHEAFLDKKVWEVGFLKDLFLNQVNFTELQKKEYIRYEDMALQTSDGRRVEVEFVSNVYLVNHHKVIQCNLRDITERKRAEAVQARLVAILEASPDFVGYADAKDGQILYINRSGRKMVGLGQQEDLSGVKISDVHPEWVSRKLREDMMPVASRDGFWSGEAAFRHRDGREIPVWMVLQAHRSPGGSVEIFSTVSRDITERKQAAEALRASEQEFRSLADSMPQIVWTCRPDGANIYFNQQWVNYTGMTLEESYGPGWNKPFHPDDQQRAWDAWHNATQNNGTYSLECRLRRADGAYRWWLVRSVPLRNASGEILKWFGTCTDIEDIKQAQDALHKREADLELAQQIGHIGSWESDLATGALVWSKESYRIFGCDPAVFVPTREAFFQLIHAEDRACVREAVEQSIRSGTDYAVEHRIRRLDGTERVVAERGCLLRDAQGKAGRLVGTTQDITERKRAEQTLRDSQELYSSLVQNLPQSVFRKDREGRFLFCNERFCADVGRSLQDIVGKTDAELFPPQLAAAYRQDDLRVMASGQVLDQVEQHIGTNGRKMYVQVVKTPLLSASRAVIGVQGIFWDITEQKNLEMQLLRAQRLEAVGTMAGGIAHDLNNILAPILMGAPMLRYVQNPAETAATLNAIESSAQRAASVVRQLLTFSRGQSGQKVTLHLKHLLRDLRSIIRETFPKNITFTLSEPPDLWPLVADPTQLHQILLNLCINARDAMPEGGTLAVTAANFQVDDHYASMVPGARPGPYMHLQVDDTGNGIQPENLDKIFDPFFTTKEVGKGTGLGLATVHRVVTGHGGFVRVHSQVGKGTIFDVYLPASPEAVSPANPASPASLLRGHGELILVVDDEANIRQMTEKTLLRQGYRALTATDGADAIAVFAQYKTEVKAVLTDLMMPGMDGLGLVKVLAHMKPGLPVILSTGVGDDPERYQTFAAMGHLGVSIMLTKPYSAAELLNALHAVLPKA